MKLKLLSYKGRMRRRDFAIIALAIALIFSPLIYYLDFFTASVRFIPYYLIAAALFVLGVFQIIKRLHDIGLRGLYWLVILIPVINLGFELWLLFKPGMQGPNKYGEDPKGLNNNGNVLS